MPSVALNTSLLPGSAGAVNLGSAALPFGTLFVSGTSGTPASNNFQFTGVATAARTITIPDASGTICLTTGNCSGVGGVIGGAGTANQLAKFTGTGTTVGNSSITDDGTNVTLASNVNLVLQGVSAYITNNQGQGGSEAFGGQADVTAGESTAVGFQSISGYDAVSVGYDSSSGHTSVAVGGQSSANWDHGVAVGWSALNTGAWSTAVGDSASAGQNSTALGLGAIAGSNSSLALGAFSATTAVNQLVIGGSTSNGTYIQDAYIGSGVTDATPAAITVHATGGSGANVGGANLNLAGGIGTGTGNGGDITLQVATPGIAGSGANSLASVLTVSGTNGSATFKNGVDSTTAFQIEDSTGKTLFNVDTAGSNINIGSVSSVHRLQLGRRPTKWRRGQPDCWQPVHCHGYRRN